MSGAEGCEEPAAKPSCAGSGGQVGGPKSGTGPLGAKSGRLEPPSAPSELNVGSGSAAGSGEESVAPQRTHDVPPIGADSPHAAQVRLFISPPIKPLAVAGTRTREPRVAGISPTPSSHRATSGRTWGGYPMRINPHLGTGRIVRSARSAGVGEGASAWACRRPGSHQLFAGHSHTSGSVGRPPRRTSKCRCGPVEAPVDPTRPISCSAFTRCPTVTKISRRWP